MAGGGGPAAVRDRRLAGGAAGIGRGDGVLARARAGAHGRTPFGGVDVRVRVDDGRLVITEDVVSGPARLVPARLRAAGIGARNVETLGRLAQLAETPTP